MTDYAYASVDDVGVHLDPNVLGLPAGTDFAMENVEAARVIRSSLYVTHIPNDVIDTWLTPDDTPEMIRNIAGMLVAARVWGRQTSSESDDVNPYAVRLYTQAMAMLEGIIDGRLVVPELVAAGVTVSGTSHITDVNFYPNDGAKVGDQIKFRMGMEL